MDLKEIALNESKKRHPWELARLKVVTSILEKHLEDHQIQFNVLDVGSGDIFLIKELSKHFKQANFYAVDIGYSQDYLQKENKSLQKQKMKIQLFDSLENASNVINGPIDLILLLDVIEHVPDDKKFLSDLRVLNKINEETLFLITVPAYQSLFCSHDEFLGHFRRYDNTLLKETVGKTQLKVIQIGYFFSALVLPRVIQVLIEKIFKKKENPTGIGNWEGGEFSSKVFEQILVFDFRISDFLRKFKIKLPGLSNYAVCKIFVS